MAHAYLIDKHGNRIAIGATVTSFRGEKAIVTGWPHDGHNRVWIRWAETDEDGEYFPSVFELRMVRP